MATDVVMWWDVDGVLLAGGGLASYLAETWGIPPDLTRPFLTGPFRDCLVGTRDLREILGPALREWGWMGTPDAFLRGWFRDQRRVNAVVRAAIARGRSAGVPQYLATNQEPRRLRFLTEELGMAAWVDGVLASCTLGAAKPSPAFFTRALAQVDVPSPAAVHFWDDCRANVAAARDAGLSAHLYVDAASLARDLDVLGSFRRIAPDSRP
jgi:putative hydrolase of the HAD superfamily